MTDNGTNLSLLSDLVAKAQRRGADAADALLVNSASLSIAYRLGALEKLERSESGDIGLRVFIGRRQAIVSSSQRDAAALDDLVERAVAMARTVPEDPFCGLADPDQLTTALPALDICDPAEPSADTLIDMVRTTEGAARAVPGITNSEGAEAGWGRTTVVLAASNGFAHSYDMSGVSLSVTVLAGDDASGKERDYDYSSAVYLADLRSPTDVGTTAGTRAVLRLGGRKVPTQSVPVVFARRAAGGLVSHLLGAINGASVARGTSFLKDRLEQRVFAPGITIIEDPHRHRGLRSKPCDGEGLPNRSRRLIDDGVLTTWLLDLRSARQLGLPPTGHASRGTSGPPSPSATNVYLDKGKISATTLISDIRQGLYVTELSGMGVNGITGDYSRGATGLWIENGKFVYPVNEITIAGNLKDMFLNLTAADDLEFRYGVDSPTLRVEGMTVAGL
ncbi:MAG: TldD/PmbA family protein [Alphaproteobacteria bacterium]